MDESRLLTHIARRSHEVLAKFPHVRVGPGDDCALVTLAGQELLLKVDQLVVGRHCTPETPLELVARKAIARALSDIAAMAGTPVCGLVSAILPPEMSDADARTLSDALHATAAAFQCPIVGGDLATHAARTDSSLSAPLSLSVSLLATPHATRGAVLRSTARTGDEVYVTGALGGSFEPAPSPRAPFPGGGKHLTFTPRLAEAAFLADALAGDLTAMLDVSDGLGIDAGRLASASHVRLELDARAIPLAHATRPLLAAISDGEDYELLFTARAGCHVPTACPATGTPFTHIGRVVAGAGCVLLRDGAPPLDIASAGWNHGSSGASHA